MTAAAAFAHRTPEDFAEVGSDLASTALTLARRCNAGATMWCVSPDWPHHARHVAVEFVHPVIVGKRALPAVALGPTDTVTTLRASVRPGDVIVAVGTADTAAIAETCLRAQAWGAITVWIGAGPRPPIGTADHVLWLPGDEPLAAVNGRFILLYHLLWELTHVCFEHPGLLTLDDDDCTDEVCITCSDEGRIAEVVRRDDTQTLVRTATGTELIDTTLVGDVAPHTLVLVHAGMAITVLDPVAQHVGVA